MFGFFGELSPLVRTLISLAILGAGVWMTLDAKGGQTISHEATRDGRDVIVVGERPNARYVFRTGVFLCGLGTTLFCVSSRSSSEKSGYRF